ncbi:MAG: hypothetical protein CMJ64_28775 [Planctomycetaceae bacterium]|nr:hypothetical protein [Planctomycetaceae bacterium]
MRDLMDGFWGADGGQLTTLNFVPKVDLVERENEFAVTVDLPGLKPEEVKVEFKGVALWIVNLSLLVIKRRNPDPEGEGPRYATWLPILGFTACVTFLVFHAVSGLL